MDLQTKRQLYIGRFASEADAARAYDCAAVRAHGPDAKRNCPGEAMGELPSAFMRRYAEAFFPRHDQSVAIVQNTRALGGAEFGVAAVCPTIVATPRLFPRPLPRPLPAPTLSLL
jgi:hypothetical protein